ncbi:MAG: hypothetical protein FWC61_01020 [Proteobacteria bacterium]|nr:hypothetical protein [Pseudomonadota bacterium]
MQTKDHKDNYQNRKAQRKITRNVEKARQFEEGKKVVGGLLTSQQMGKIGGSKIKKGFKHKGGSGPAHKKRTEFKRNTDPSKFRSNENE